MSRFVAGAIGIFVVAAALNSPATSAPQTAPGQADLVVLDGPSYSRGPNEHWVTCVPKGATGPAVDILISAEAAYAVPAAEADDPFLPGKPCPAGPQRP